MLFQNGATPKVSEKAPEVKSPAKAEIEHLEKTWIPVLESELKDAQKLLQKLKKEV